MYCHEMVAYMPEVDIKNEIGKASSHMPEVTNNEVHFHSSLHCLDIQHG